MSLGLRSGFSRIPVIGDNLDSVVGVAYLKDVTKRVFDNRDAESTEKVDTVMRPVTWVPDSKPVDALLREMQAERTHLAVVVDEYGGTAGLVTIEDILEEIVASPTSTTPRSRCSSTSTTAGTASPRVCRSTTSAPSSSREDVEFVAASWPTPGQVPIAGSVVEAHGLHFEVESTGGAKRVATVLITVLPDPDGRGPVGDVTTADEQAARSTLKRMADPARSPAPAAGRPPRGPRGRQA